MRQPRVEFFDVMCVCGRTISGQRLPRPQAVACPDCGEGVFVLPTDAYPPVTLVDRRSGWRGSARSSTRFRDRWLGGGLAFAAQLASGRMLLIAILATMTASLSFAFWIDAQSHRRAAPPDTEPLNAAAAPIESRTLLERTVGSKRVLTGRVENGAVVLDDPADLPDGAPVEIRMIPHGSGRDATSEEAAR